FPRSRGLQPAPRGLKPAATVITSGLTAGEPTAMPSQSKFWGILFGAAAALCGLLFIVSPALGWWLPTGASSYSGGIDFLFYLILGVVGFFFVLTEGVLVYNMVKYRHQPGRKAEFTHGNHRLEIIWSAVPAAI